VDRRRFRHRGRRPQRLRRQNENTFLPTDFQRGNPADPSFPAKWGDARAEYRLFFNLGIDGVFSDQAIIGVEVRDAIFPKRGG